MVFFGCAVSLYFKFLKSASNDTGILQTGVKGCNLLRGSLVATEEGLGKGLTQGPPP